MNVKNSLKKTCLLLAATLLSAQAFSLDVTDRDTVEAFIDGAVKPLMQNKHGPAGVVIVMKDDEVILNKGYGYQDLDKKIPVDAYSTLFRPGSISKLFTWIAVLQMEEQGKLDLDADVNEHLTQFKVKDAWEGQPVTMRHIMTHRGGLEDGFFGYLIIDDAEAEAIRSRLAPLMADDNPWRHSARELAAHAAMRGGDRKAARELFTKLAGDGAAPGGVRSRASEMLSVLGD